MRQAAMVRLGSSMAVLSLTLALAACGGDGLSLGGDVSKTIVSGNAAGKGVVDVDPAIFAKEVPCPPLEVEAGNYLTANYARGKDNDPRGLRYQASLEKWARKCRREGGEVKMTLGVSGRVTPGPAWKGGEILLPIRVTYAPLSDEGGKSEVKMFTVPVTVGEGAPAEQWALVEQGLVIPQDRSIKVQIALTDKKRRR
ncbi:hypothetical protein H1W37_10040 [Stappia taiwanensis]|uniref:Lipoprotein n=1 Tax=Stappia taiwanensis TaxID=992267 RepID=A0A838XYP8_9HYPH|nr:hypothetical protein [Stappia taiwanensis]MBA4611993.1 hypothetical protein [Stappia taiwanensis]